MEANYGARGGEGRGGVEAAAHRALQVCTSGLGEGLPESDSSARSTSPEEEEEGRLGDGGASGSCPWSWTTILTAVKLRDALKRVGSSGRRGGRRWAETGGARWRGDLVGSEREEDRGKWASGEGARGVGATLIPSPATWQRGASRRVRWERAGGARSREQRGEG